MTQIVYYLIKIHATGLWSIPVKDGDSSKKYHENCSLFPHCTDYRKPLQEDQKHFTTQSLRSTVTSSARLQQYKTNYTHVHKKTTNAMST